MSNRTISPMQKLSVDHYRIGKSMQRTLDREAVGRWGGRGDWKARNAIALMVWNIEWVLPTSLVEPTACVLPPLFVENDAVVEMLNADAEREARLAKRRERDRARRAAAKEAGAQ